MLMSMHVTLCYQGNHILTGICLEILISLQSKSKRFLVVFFKCLDHFMVVLFVLVILKPILDVFFFRFSKNPEIIDDISRWPPFRKDDTIFAWSKQV